jgi:Na+-driven multidrug efflux pump
MSEPSVPAPSAAKEGWWRTQGRMLRFFVPLAVQSASQSLSFLLVASIVAHGALREQELAAFSQISDEAEPPKDAVSTVIWYNLAGMKL